jgi:two-component system response regulator YcbB
MTSLASFGIENEENSLYKEYAYSLFDIKQVKQEIKHLKHPSFIQGKINTKKFIEGILIKILN